MSSNLASDLIVEPRQPAAPISLPSLTCLALPATRDRLAVRDPGDKAASLFDLSVLVVDDDESCRDVARGILSAAGFDVVCAEDSRKAFDVIDTGKHIDVALVDVRMPHGMPHGASFAAMAQVYRPSLKFIFMSACRFAYTLLDDSDTFVRKPFAPYHLLDVVTRAIRKKERAREASSARIFSLARA